MKKVNNSESTHQPQIVIEDIENKYSMLIEYAN